MNTKEAPVKYRTTWISVIVVMVFTILAALALRLAWARENARRDKDALAASLPGRPESFERLSRADFAHGDLAKLREAGLGTPSGSLRGSMSLRGSQTSVVEGVMQVDRDLTDWEDRGFRYSL